MITKAPSDTFIFSPSGHPVSVISNLSISFAAKTLSTVVQLAGTMIIARVLTPEELGSFAVAAAAAGLLTALRNFGTSNYLVQARTVDASSVGSAFFVTASISWSLAAILFSTRHAQALFFDAPAVSLILAVLAFNFVLSPFVMTGTSLLMRAQEFRALVTFEVICAIGGVSTSVLLALFGFGAVSLAIGMTINSLGLLFLVLTRRPSGLTYRPSVAQWAEVIRFGGWASGITLLNQITARSPEIVVGRVLGVAYSAVYDKGAALSRLVWEQLFGEIVRVLLPAFAQEARSNRDIADIYFQRVSAVFSLLTPIFLFFAFHASPLIYILFGDQWAASAPIATLIAIGGAILSPFVICEQLLIGSGAIRYVFLLKLAQAFAMLAALALLLPFGLNVASASVLFSSIVYVGLSQKITMSHLNSNGRALFLALRPSFMVVSSTVAAGLASNLLFGYTNTSQPFSHICIGGLLTILAWIATSAWLRHPSYLFGREVLTQIINRFADAIRAKKL